MADYSVLIADSSEDFCRAMAERLDGSCCVSACCRGGEALELVRVLRPEVLVVDLMLPELDGLSLLRAVAASGRKPGVLVTTDYVSSYILQAAGELGVNAVLERPCDPETAARQVRKLLGKQTPVREELRSRISGLLLQMGFSAKLRGYAYLREAIYRMMLDPDRPLVKDVYAGIGSTYGITGKLVEHGIRRAIRAAWEDRDRELWCRYFGPGQLLRPTSAAFIRTAAASLGSCGDTVLRKASGEN